MTMITLDDGLHLHYQVDGAADGPPLIFSNSLGTNLGMWDAQAAFLSQVFRIVRYDTRGHGRSGVPAGSATIERLGRDLLALLDHLSIARAQLCGLSLGGLTAQWLAVYHPERVSRLVLANTAARIGSIEGWGERIAAVRQGGMAAVRNAVLARFFSPAFSLAHPQTLQVYAAMLTATDPQGYAACCAALREADLRAEVGSITAPTLIIAGALDEATPPAQAEELRAAIPGSELVVLDEVAHLSNIERPDAFSSLLLGA